MLIRDMQVIHYLSVSNLTMFSPSMKPALVEISDPAHTLPILSVLSVYICLFFFQISKNDFLCLLLSDLHWVFIHSKYNYAFGKLVKIKPLQARGMRKEGEETEKRKKILFKVKLSQA